MDKEKIDVLLATYNGEKYVAEQIESILNQTYKNINLIISDDCSSDKTQEILREYSQKDSRIKLYLQQENLGVVKNIEFLLKQVENPLYMLADQDDYWLPEKIEKSVEKLNNENADLVFGDLEVVDQNLKAIYPSFGDFMLLNRKINKYIDSYKVNYLYNCVTGCTLISKKEFIKYILPLPTNSKFVIHDHWIGLMVSLNGKLAYMPEKYIKYRQHGNNQVGTNKISHGFTRLEQVREHFINVKLGVFGTYVDNKERFPKDIQELNERAYKYFKMLETKKNINFKGWTTFHELYKTEKLMYYLENFMIMNMPVLVKPVFGLRRKIKKIKR
ncbi:MAG: glycosyltransferase family 2 protein [Clostridia bacterium]|nr:glycosyltransferase family 2 protein [Clostridia bacterium]